jgi:L-asparaginase II
MPLKNLAVGFARLATGENLPDGLAGAARRIRGAMREHPYMVAGTGRLDTALMQATDLMAKSGAEGVFAAASPEGWGLALKISDGALRAVRPAALASLARRSVEVPEILEPLTVEDLHGVPVGRIEPLL